MHRYIFSLTHSLFWSSFQSFYSCGTKFEYSVALLTKVKQFVKYFLFTIFVRVTITSFYSSLWKTFRALLPHTNHIFVWLSIPSWANAIFHHILKWRLKIFAVYDKLKIVTKTLQRKTLEKVVASSCFRLRKELHLRVSTFFTWHLS